MRSGGRRGASGPDRRARAAGLPGRGMARPRAGSEPGAELLCAELPGEGLPMARALAEQVLASFIGPRPRSDTEAVAARAARDAEVLRHAPAGVTADLRSPAQVKSLLARIGVDVPDTRASRVRELRAPHPPLPAPPDWPQPDPDHTP